jgi:pimeloyl-ACP methyl ester carboxylesterase
MPTFTSAAGTPLHYTLRGQGPLLVCHPGGPGRPASYLDTLGGVDRTRTLLLLDPRGVGGSAPAGSYAYPGLADDLDALRRHLGVERLDLLAHSAGTWPVLTFAAAHPDRVGRVVLLTPPWRILGPVDAAEMVALAERYFGHEPWYPAAVDAFRAFDPSLPDERIDALLADSAPLMYGTWDEAARQHATRPYDSTSAPAARAGFWVPGFDPTGLAKLASPVTVVAGELDILTGPTAPATIASWFADATVTWLPGSGHMPWVDHPEETARAVDQALAR